MPLSGTLLDCPSSTERCWAMQAKTCILCNAKVGVGKHDIPTPTYKGLEKEFYSTNNVEHTFGFALMNQELYKWQQEDICVGLAYSSQHMTGEDRHQSIN